MIDKYQKYPSHGGGGRFFFFFFFFWGGRFFGGMAVFDVVNDNDNDNDNDLCYDLLRLRSIGVIYINLELPCPFWDRN